MDGYKLGAEFLRQLNGPIDSTIAARREIGRNEYFARLEFDQRDAPVHCPTVGG